MASAPFSSKTIIGIVGPKGVGKGTVTKYLNNQYQAQTITFSDILVDILNTLSLPLTRKAAIDLAICLRSTFGEQVLGQAMATRVAKLQADLVAIDGIRYPQDFVTWQGSKKFVLLALTADQQTRFERIRKRGRTHEEQTLSWEQFTEEENKPTETNIASIAQSANYTIDTTGPVDEVYRQIDAMMKEIRLLN